MSRIARQEYEQSYKSWAQEKKQAPQMAGTEPRVPAALTTAEARAIRVMISQELELA